MSLTNLIQSRSKSPKLDFQSLFDEYVESVISGRRIAGRMEKHAVIRWQHDLKRIGDDDFPYIFAPAFAIRVCEFFSRLKHSDGEYANRPFILYPWQVFIIFQLFGWVQREPHQFTDRSGQEAWTHLRRYRDAFVSVGRGNGKSPFGAGLMLYMLRYDNEPRAEVYVSAVKRDQARIAFNAAKRFVRESPPLQRRITIQTSRMSTSDDSVFEPLSSDGRSSDGLNIHGLLRDEVHAWDENKREYYEKLTTALAKRRQPLAMTITTAGSEESLIWREEYEYCKQVVDVASPVVNDSQFVMVFEIDEKDSELDESVWEKANPMLEYGVVKIDSLRTLASKAKHDSTFRAQFRRYHCNRLAYSHRKSFSPEVWVKGNRPIPWDSIEEVYVGVDLGKNDDLSAVGVVAPLDWVSVEGISKRNYAVWCKAWTPEETRRDLNKQPFARLVYTDRLTVTSSQFTDIEHIYEYIEDLANRYEVRVMAVDRHNASEFAKGVVKMGLEVEWFQQNCPTYNEPFREMKQAVADGRIIHENDELLGWSALNVVEVENAAGHIMPDKRKSIEKIDCFVAVLMAYGKALLDDEDSDCVYDHFLPSVI